jgi:hypothetical protein
MGPWLYTPNGLRRPSGPVALYTRMCSVEGRTGSPAERFVATSGLLPTHRGKYFDGGCGGGAGGAGDGGLLVQASPRHPDVQWVLWVLTHLASGSTPPKQWCGGTSWFHVQMSQPRAASHRASQASTLLALPSRAECGPASATASTLSTTFHWVGGGGGGGGAWWCTGDRGTVATALDAMITAAVAIAIAGAATAVRERMDTRS